MAFTQKSSYTAFLPQQSNLAAAKELGLDEAEYQQIYNILKRQPTSTELGMFSALWSEHCSYKNSIRLLKTLPTRSKRTLTEAGQENAGALDIGNGLAVVFKIESHNHPSAIEPYQGAATGVGGIMRDIFTMGARPLCSLNSLRFGPPSTHKDSTGDGASTGQESRQHNRYLFSRAVKGIGDYGNSLGVPVAGGEVFFDDSFSRNCLVNAMVVGIAKSSELAFAKAQGEANPVFIVGSTTGRDGIHGASFASQDLTEQSSAKRSAVQVGDPFLEKLLLEATLELLASDAVVAIQDMGAAGLSCASAEMSAKGRVGMELDLDKVPLRENGMNAFEIMLSESQERMLLVVAAGKEKQVQEICERWELFAVQIGKVSSDGLLRVYHQGEICAQIPAESLVLGGGAPRYKRKMKRPAYLDKQKEFGRVGDLPQISDIGAVLLDLLGSPNLCSRRPLYEQYDSEVGLNRIIGPGEDAGVVRIPNSRCGLAVATDCNSRYVYLEPYIGTASAVCESARNVAVHGARPIGITNCLNFANPYIEENYYMFGRSVRGMRAACKALNVPVTGGNVSFYNETKDRPIFPTPTIGMVGLINDLYTVTSSHFQGPDQSIYLLGDFQPTFGGSEYLYHRYKKVAGLPPVLNLKMEANLIDFLVEAAEQKLVTCAHDLSMGGLSLALFRCAYNVSTDNILGFCLEAGVLQDKLVGPKELRQDLLFFGETNGCALLSAYPEKHTLLVELAQKKGLPLYAIGKTTAAKQEFDFGFFQIKAGQAVERFNAGFDQIF